MADTGHYRGKGGTRQGIYVMAPGGRLLASLNSLDPRKVEEAMRRGLAAWRELSAAERRLAPGTLVRVSRRWETNCPKDGLVLTLVKRDLPDSGDPLGARKTAWNRDHAWFNRTEARSFLPADPLPGQVHSVPDQLVQRLARFHLVDNVRGQTLPFAVEEVEGSSLQVEIMAVEEGVVHLHLTGDVRAVADGVWRLGDNDWNWSSRGRWPRGVKARLLGWAEFDLSAGAFTAFELVAQALRWGHTPNNGRRNEPAASPFGVFFRLAPPTPAGCVAPAFIDVYDADWVVPPERSSGS